MHYSNKFHRNPKDKHNLVTKFPVAIKSSHSTATSSQQSSEWTQVIAEVEQEDNDQIDLGDVQVLHSQQKVQWINLLYKILSLGDLTGWRISVLILIVINYVQVSYAYFFLRDSTNLHAYYSIVVCDTIYGIDFAFAVAVYFWKDLQLRLVNPPRSKKAIISDAFLVLPYSFIYEMIYKDTNSVAFIILRSISFLRLYHLFRFFKAKSNSAGTNHWKYFITQYFIYFFLLQHGLACLWYLLACPLDCVKHTGWTIALRNLARQYPKTHFDWYIACMYFALINLTTSGFGDVIATNDIERILAAFNMAIGFTLTVGVFIGTLTSQFVNSSLRKALLQNQIIAIKRHCTSINLTKSKVQEIMNYYCILWTKKKGIREAEDFKLLPTPLRMEICFDVNFSLLQCTLIFRDKPEPFLRALSLKMKHEFYQTGDIIYHQHVIKYKMVCVASGVIEILSDEDNQSPIISFTAGTCIGEAALVFTLPARATIRAACYTEIQALYKKDYLQMIECFPEICTEIRNQIIERIDDAQHHSLEAQDNKETVTLSLYVSHNRKLSEIKKLKDRLNPKTAYMFDSLDTFYRKCLPMYRYSENIKKAKQKHLCLTENFPWILQPDTALTWTWEVIILINVILIGILYPFYIAFERGFPPWLDSLSILLEAINVIDIYIILTTAIEEKDHTIKTFRAILFKRMNTIGFYFDVFSAFYIEVFSYVIDDTLHWFYILKLNRMLKMYRIVKFFTHLEGRLTACLFTIRLIKYPIYLIMCPYWFGAILYMETCLREICEKGGWYYNKILEDLFYRLRQPCTENIVYVSVYYAFSCLSGLGYGDLLPGNQKDLIIISLGVLVGIFVFGYCTAEFSSTFTHNLKKKTDFQEALYSLKKFMMDNHMSSAIRKRVLNFFVLQWYYNEGVSVINKQSLLHNATWKIQQDVLVKERLETIVRIPLFHNMDLDFLQLIATGSRVIILPPKEMVIYAGGLSSEMYIIQDGYCELLNANEQQKILGPSSHFGMENLLYGTPSLMSVRTITHIKLINIEATTFIRATSIFPAIGKELQTIGDELNILKNLTNLNKGLKVTGYQTDRSLKTKNYKRYFSKLGGSFVNAYVYSKKHREDYDKPFRILGSLSWLKYFLLPICILPSGCFIKCWVTVRIIAASLLCLLTPYQFIQAPYIPQLDNILFGMDIIAYADLYIMMLVGYYGDKNQLVIHPYKTAARYLKGLFGIDLVLCFPWEILVKILLPDHNEGHSKFSHSLSPHSLHCLFRSLRVFQVYRLPLAFHNFESDITKKGDILQVLKFVPFSIMFINAWASIVIVTSCKYYHISDFSKNSAVNGTARIAGMARQKLYEYTMICQEDDWLDRSKYHAYTKPFNIYMTAIYWCTGTLVGSGVGDITAQDKTHLLVTMCMIIFGVLFFGYIYASIGSHKAELHSSLSHHQEKLTELKSFMEYESVNSGMQNKIIDYYEYLWKRTAGTEPNIILANLHTALLEDAVLYMYEETLREVPLFEHVERSFFRIIGKELRERYYTRGQTVIRSDDVIDNLFIIYRGKVEVTSSYNEMQTYMGVGGLFGNVTPQSKVKCIVTITAIRNLDTLFIPTEKFYSILKRYPEVKRKMDVILQEANDYIMPTTIISSSDSEDNYASFHHAETEESSFSNKEAIASKSSGSTGGTAATGSVGIRTGASVADFFLPHKWCRIAVIPDAFIFTVYSYIAVIAAYVNSILVTYQFAFQHHTVHLLVLAVVLDVIFILKMFLEIHKAYINRYGDYVVDNRKIRHFYFKNRKMRILDFVSNMPICYLAFFLPLITNVDSYLVFSSVRMVTLLRCYYILEFYKMHSNKLMVNTLRLKISTIFMWITLIVHLLACVWYLHACPLTYCRRKSWLTAHMGKEKQNKFSIYISCFYYIMNILTTTGTGDIQPENKIEIIYTAIIMLITKFCIGIFIGDVTSVLNAYTSSLVNYEYGIKELRDDLHNKNVSNHQMEKMWNYVRQLWTRSRGKQIPRLIQQLPYVMRYDLMNEIYGQHLRNSYIFWGTEESFIRQLTERIENVIFFPGNYIVQDGDSDQSMYFIHRGEVDILTVHSNLTETIHDVLYAGEMFGIAQGLFHGVPHRFSFRARTTVDIILLQLSKWQDLLKFFPRSKELIYKRAEEVYVKN